MSQPLNASKCSIGKRVITTVGALRTGTVRAVDVAFDLIAVRFDGDEKNTIGCDPATFAVSPDPTLRLTGKAPANTVARGSI